jgi:hypothetical protein
VGQLDLHGRIILKWILLVLGYENVDWFHMVNERGNESSVSSKFYPQLASQRGLYSME